MRIGRFAKLLLTSGQFALSFSVLAQGVPQVGTVDVDGSLNQGAPVISQSGSIPPPLTAQQLAKQARASGKARQ